MIQMKMLSVIVYAIALLLTISPAFSYVVLTKFFLSTAPFTAQIVSVVPMIAGVVLLMVLRYKKI